MPSSVIYTAATIPANTPKSAPVTIDLSFPPQAVSEIDITVPPGPSGLMGFQLWVLGGQAVPVTTGKYIVADGRNINWQLKDQPNSGAWQLVGYNTDIYDHTVYIEFIVEPVTIGAASDTLIPMTDLSPASYLGITPPGVPPPGPVPSPNPLPLPQVPTTVATYVGAVSSPVDSCPSNVNDWLAHAVPTIGPVACNKIFYSGNQPMTTFAQGHKSTDNESLLPPGTLIFVTFKDAQVPNLAGYVESIPDAATVVMIYWQEAEDSFPNGDYNTFIANTINASNIIRGVGKPNVFVAQDCASFQYGIAGSDAQLGHFLVPPAHVDYYTVDIYQHFNTNWPSAGLSNYTRWLNWLAIFAGQGKPLAITEYGVDVCGGTAVRNQRIKDDCAYLRTAFNPSSPSKVSPFPLLAWEYWWSNCGAGQLNTTCDGQYQFTDATTLATWQQIATGAL